MKGGYQLVDFKNIDLTDGAPAILIPGVRESIDNSNSKMQIITGFKFATVSRPDFPAYFFSTGGNNVAARTFGTISDTNPDTFTAVIITVSETSEVSIAVAVITSAI